MKINKSWLLAGLVVSLTIFGVLKATNIRDLTNTNALMLDGSLYFGDSQDPAYVTMPTVSTSDKFSVKVPFYNASGATTARGTVILASTTITTNGTIYGTYAAILATTTVLGVSDGAYATGTKGMMTIAGYCSVLTTGTIPVGGILVTTTAVAGYAGLTTGTQVVGTMIGKAVEYNSAQGLTTILMRQ